MLSVRLFPLPLVPWSHTRLLSPIFVALSQFALRPHKTRPNQSPLGMEFDAFEQMAKRSWLHRLYWPRRSSKTNEIPRQSKTNPGHDRHLLGMEQKSYKNLFQFAVISWFSTIAAFPDFDFKAHYYALKILWTYNIVKTKFSLTFRCFQNIYGLAAITK